MTSCAQAVVLTAALAALGGCTSAASRGLPSRPDTTRMQPEVAAQVTAGYDTLERAAAAAGDASAIAEAYAGVGKLLLAAEDGAAAEPFLTRAAQLAPADARWPYLLGHLHRGTGDYAAAVRDFEATVRLEPDHEAAAFWLGSTLLDSNEPDRAVAMFARLLERHPDSVAAVAGLGRAALARRDYVSAASRLEAALQRRPDASALRYPLAMAYRALGRTGEAEAQLALRGSSELTPSDPQMRELATLLTGSNPHELRGDRALDEGNYPAAAAFFREAARQSAAGASVHHKLGTTLYLIGDRAGARAELIEAVRLDPGSAPPHYSLGVLLAERGEVAAALAEFAAAVRIDGRYAEARLAYADALRQTGRLDEAITQYTEVIRGGPGNARAKFGLGVALARAGRFAEARDVLSAGADAHPDHPELAHALARVLAASRDPNARDGARAVRIAEQLARATPTIDVAETMAMALAEAGRFTEAAAMQREAIKAARAMGDASLVSGLQPNLARYEARQPCRTLWRDGDPVDGVVVASQ